MGPYNYDPSAWGSMAKGTAEAGIEHPLHLADITAPNIDIRKSGDWTAFYDCQVHHFVGGRFWVKVDTLPLPLGVLDLHAEIRILSNVAGIRDVVVSGVADSFSGPLIFSLHGYRSSFVQLVFEAREIVNGLPSSQDVPTFNASVVGRLFR